MESGGNKRKSDLGMAVEDGGEPQSGSTSSDNPEATKSTKRRRFVRRERLNPADAFDMAFAPPETVPRTATPGRSILKPARSSHTATPTSPTIEPAFVATAVTAKPRKARTPSASSKGPASETTLGPPSDEEAENTIYEATRSLNERGNRYKQHLLETQKEVSDLRLEKAEALRELQEARVRIEKLQAEKEKAENRWRIYKGQFKEVLQRSKGLGNDLRQARNQSAYLEKLLAFEERSGFSTLVSEMQLQ